MEEPGILQVVDYIVIVVVLLIPVSIGVYFAHKDAKNSTREEYLLGGRHMSMIPVMLSLFVTFQSAISLIGVPSDMYYHGVMIVFVYAGLCLSYCIGLFTFVPLFYPLHLTSVFEYLELRFESRALRVMATGLGMLQTICYMAIVILTPALALQAAAGIPLWVSVVIVGVVGTVYTAIGGIKSVVWTDAFQVIIVFAGMFAIIIKGSMIVGGFDEAIILAHEGGRLNFLVFDPRDRHSWWGCIIGGAGSWMVNTCNQSTVQRISAMKTMKDVKMSYKLNIAVTMLYGIMLTLAGIVVYAYFVTIKCDPHEGGLITNTNQLAPYYVLNGLRDLPGIAGLYMAALFCGSLSTLSSGINALAANTVEDFLKTRLESVTESKATMVTKIIVCFYGLVVVALAYGAKEIKGPVTQIVGSIFGAIGGPLVGVFLVAGSVPWANKYGVLWGGICSVIITIWASVGNQIFGVPRKNLPSVSTEMCYVNSTVVENVIYQYNTSTTISSAGAMDKLSLPLATEDPLTYHDDTFFLYRISYEWYGVSGVLLTFILSVIISFFSRSCTKSEINPKLIFPLLRKYWSLPEPRHLNTDESNLKVSENIEASSKLIEDFKHKELTLVVTDEANGKSLSESNRDKRSNENLQKEETELIKRDES